MFTFWERMSKKRTSRSGQASAEEETAALTEEALEPEAELQGKEIRRMVVPVPGLTIVELAAKNEVDWSSFCTRGTCARCRCHVSRGAENLSGPNPAEEARLDPEEIEAGYRLGCQARIERPGPVSIKHTPYF